jgi:hypothetical protein
MQLCFRAGGNGVDQSGIVAAQQKVQSNIQAASNAR